MSSTRVPRASIAISVLRDPDFIRLVGAGRNGRDAALLYLSLIIAAKDQQNSGRFDCPPTVLASLVRWPSYRDVLKAIETLTNETNWIEFKDGKLTIRSYEKWNPSDGSWGGSRDGSGRKPSGSKKSSRRIKNQDEKIKNQDDTPPQVGIGNGNGKGLQGVQGDLPEVLNTDRFRTVWGEWIQHRREIKKPMTKLAISKQLTALAEWGEDRAIAAINHSIANRWQGIFEPQGNGVARRQPAQLKSYEELHPDES